MAGTPDQAWAKNGEKNHESVKGGAEKQGAVLLKTETAISLLGTLKNYIIYHLDLTPNSIPKRIMPERQKGKYFSLN